MQTTINYHLNAYMLLTCRQHTLELFKYIKYRKTTLQHMKCYLSEHSTL